MPQLSWVAVDYVTAPCIALAADAYVTTPAADPRLQVFILSGVRQSTPPDVMRGEEAQIAGYLS